MPKARRWGEILFGWLTVISTAVLLFTGSPVLSDAAGLRQTPHAGEAFATMRHEDAEDSRTEGCHPGMACTLGALCDQQTMEIQPLEVSGVRRVMVTRVTGQYTPLFDPPPPRSGTGLQAQIRRYIQA